MAHAGGLALDGAALRRAEPLLLAPLCRLFEEPAREDVASIRCASSEQCAPGQHDDRACGLDAGHLSLPARGASARSCSSSVQQG